MSATLSTPVAPIERLAYTVAEAAECIGLGHTRMGDQVRAGRIRVVRIGKRILIPRDALREFLDANSEPVSGEGL
jgi:excisionase family DNA binding protein